MVQRRKRSQAIEDVQAEEQVIEEAAADATEETAEAEADAAPEEAPQASPASPKGILTTLMGMPTFRSRVIARVVRKLG